MRLSLFVEYKNKSSEPVTRVLKLNELSAAYIGRENTEIQLSSEHCSKRHAVLFQNQENELVLQDLKSTNGTYVYEEKVSEAKLNVGTKFRIGKIVFTVLAYEAGGEPFEHSF